MTKKDRARFIATRLGELYPDPPVPLHHHDPFTLLVAVLLSAQCADERVNCVTPDLFAQAGCPKAMAQLGPERILPLIRSCGLAPQKAKALAALSEILTEKYSGEVPNDIAALESLPGVGHKTASVVMAQAFGVPSFPVDTHIHRLAQRWMLSSGRNVAETERDLRRLFPRDLWNRLHLQIIYYGREHCTARGCDGTVCEICRTCFPKRRRAVVTRK
ncbi:MAG TPA: endonuclease III [Verrucomicrobiales bacterium]|nr:endonuclease III [Verrucomicrobiales bacterium]